MSCFIHAIDNDGKPISLPYPGVIQGIDCREIGRLKIELWDSKCHQGVTWVIRTMDHSELAEAIDQWAADDNHFEIDLDLRRFCAGGADSKLGAQIIHT
jgi:hypothetical protein